MKRQESPRPPAAARRPVGQLPEFPPAVAGCRHSAGPSPARSAPPPEPPTASGCLWGLGSGPLSGRGAARAIRSASTHPPAFSTVPGWPLSVARRAARCFLLRRRADALDCSVTGGRSRHRSTRGRSSEGTSRPWARSQFAASRSLTSLAAAICPHSRAIGSCVQSAHRPCTRNNTSCRSIRAAVQLGQSLTFAHHVSPRPSTITSVALSAVFICPLPLSVSASAVTLPRPPAAGLAYPLAGPAAGVRGGRKHARC